MSLEGPSFLQLMCLTLLQSLKLSHSLSLSLTHTHTLTHSTEHVDLTAGNCRAQQVRCVPGPRGSLTHGQRGRQRCVCNVCVYLDIFGCAGVGALLTGSPAVGFTSALVIDWNGPRHGAMNCLWSLPLTTFITSILSSFCFSFWHLCSITALNRTLS